MERRESTVWLGPIAACLVAVAGISCGTGIRDGRGEVFTTETVGPEGGELALKEGALELWPNCLAAPATITLRRYDQIDYSGAVGPVFEVAVPTPDTFTNQPSIVIATSESISAAPSSVIGYMVPAIGQWVPDSSPVAPCTAASAVCGPVPTLSFTNPGGKADPGLTTTVLRMAIVTRCASSTECPSRQTCTSGACQQCFQEEGCQP